MSEQEFVYFGDPMCSWCWGFSPVLDKVAQTYKAPLRVVVGGLTPGAGARVLDEAMAKTIGHHWHAVEEASGQPFDHKGLDRVGWRYDTEPASIAVVTMRALAPEKTLSFFARLHRAFYADCIDITDMDTFAPLAEAEGVDVEAFMAEVRSEGMRKLAWRDFNFSRQMGVSGFPTLMARDGVDWVVLARGFTPWQTLKVGIDGWTQQQYADKGTDPGAFCTVDGFCT